jgi:tryptophanyl-tRNA synthetase
MLAEAVADHFAPMRERAAEYQARPERVHEILGDGAARCRRLAQETLREVRDRMGLSQSARAVPAGG